MSPRITRCTARRPSFTRHGRDTSRRRSSTGRRITTLAAITDITTTGAIRTGVNTGAAMADIADMTDTADTAGTVATVDATIDAGR